MRFVQTPEGKNVFLEIEIEGAKEVLSKCHGDDVISIFLVPPSLEELERRIRGRKSESDDVIQERLAKAQREIGFRDRYQYVVVNDSLSKASYQIKNIIRRRMRKIEKKESQNI